MITIVGDNNDESNKYIGGKPEFIPDTNNGTADPPYVHKRLKKFIDLFEIHREKSRDDEKRYVYLTIILGAFISVVNVFSVFDLRETQILVSIISAILGAAVSIMVGILQHEKYHQRWVHPKSRCNKITGGVLFMEKSCWRLCL